MLQDKFKATGHVWVVLKDQYGNIKQELDFDNLVVTSGKNYLCNAALTPSSSPFTYMAIGTGTTPAAVSDTALETELTRAIFTSASVLSNVITFQTVYGPGVGTGAITEAGIFNDPFAGTMFAHTVFSVVNKASTDTLTVTWQVTLN